MRDIALVAFLFAFIGVGFKKPFLFVLCFCYIDIVAPQRLSYFLINSIPISLIVFGLAIGGWLVFGGTSVAAPIIAGVYGLAANAADIDNNYPYHHTSALFDVTTGPGAGPGWDPPTGLGPPIGIGAFCPLRPPIPPKSRARRVSTRRARGWTAARRRGEVAVRSATSSPPPGSPRPDPARRPAPSR